MAWGAGLGGAAGASLQRERAAGEEAHAVQVRQRAHGALDLGLASAALRCKVELPETSSNDVLRSKPGRPQIPFVRCQQRK